MIYPREKLDNTHAVNYYRGGGPSGSIILFTNHNDVNVVVVLN